PVYRRQLTIISPFLSTLPAPVHPTFFLLMLRPPPPSPLFPYTTLFRSCPGLPLGTNVRTGVPLFSLLRSRLSQSALLAGPAHAGAWHPLSAVRQRFLAVFRSGDPAETRRFPHRRRSAHLWPKVADPFHALFHCRGEKARR